MNWTKRILFGATLAAACIVTGCASAPKTDPIVFTQNALTATASVKVSGFDTNAVQRFETFNSDYSAANISNNLKNVYADNVYFRDPFKELTGELALEAYLLRTSTAVAQYSMDWQDVAEHDGNYYFRWVMNLKLKRDGKNAPLSHTTGISFVRFGPDGKVIFHQDYFDAAAFLYEKIPVLGGEIRFIKKRL